MGILKLIGLVIIFAYGAFTVWYVMNANKMAQIAREQMNDDRYGYKGSSDRQQNKI